ncbi:peptide-methionine (S)-S-oxide reductase MsrA [Qipengyuania sp. JC766]|uniref:peptide-methionine (S)-S-oxide reductase MsrA n=1 Tax=Qipengyuania sp. JC766 TaxID=3232139 RepID=UPI00345A2B21
MIARALLPIAAAGVLALAGCGTPPVEAKEQHLRAPVPERTATEPQGLQTAVFAGGCFWGVEAVFSHVKGVKSVVAGYHGGNAATANYDAVNSGVTRHAEAVRIEYDPSVVRYDELLQILFSVVADPTLHNRQGPDTGSEYRAALVPLTDEQRAVAAAYLEQMQVSGVWNDPIVTEIEDYREFFVAEEKHQDFALNNPDHSYIVYWDKPKIEALREMYPDHYRAEFVPG